MSLRDVLLSHRDDLIAEWVGRLHNQVSDRYRERPVDELVITVTEAFDANFIALANRDFSRIDALIERIATLRLEGGFALSEIQAAFEAFRTVLLPVLFSETEGPNLLDALTKVNDCLEYTIRKFSDYYQSLHEELIRTHAKELEGRIEERTRELAESEAKYRVLVEDINDGYFVHVKGILVFANRAFAEMHGYTQEEAIGRPFNDFIAPPSRDELWKAYHQRITTGGAMDQYVYLRLTKDGRQLFTENKVKLITYEGNRATAGICRDITARVEVEKQRLRVAELENERKTISLETLRQLMVTLSHYLLNANTIIGGMVRRSERLDSPEARRASLQAIKEQTMKTEAVIGALRRVAEIKTTDYDSESHTLMIDVKNEIEQSLARTGKDRRRKQDQ
ncbi:MAG TPA: PAS domain S-box protein [Syntrophorhabdaceae bacterium]|jgi:PAS domain S-box-containing protein